MKRIDKRRPAVAKRKNVKSNPGDASFALFSPHVPATLKTKLEAQALSDGFSYVSEAVAVLFDMISRERISAKLARRIKTFDRVEWPAESENPRDAQVNLRLRRTTLQLALERWRALVGRQEATQTDMFRDLSIAYVTKKVEIVLRCGRRLEDDE